MAASGVTADSNTVNGYACMKVKEMQMGFLERIYPSSADNGVKEDFCMSFPTERRNFRQGTVAALGRSC